MDAVKLARALQSIETRLTEITDAYNELITAHNAMDAKLREMQYRITYTMERISVKRGPKPGAIIAAGQPAFEENTLALFYLADRETFIAEIEAQVAALHQSVERSEAGDEAIAAAVGATHRGRPS